MKKPRISVIIPTHKDFRKVSRAIDSILAQSLRPYEVIVIDNFSRENISKKVTRKYKNNRKVKITRLEKNAGVTGGRNAGILHSSKKAEYLFFFDHDMIADYLMLEELYKTLSQYKAGITTPKIYFKNEKNSIWAAGTDINLVTGKVIFRSGKDIGQFDKDTEVSIAPAAMLVNKDVIHSIGGFDDRYFATYEDSDFSFRAKKAGFTIYYSSKARAKHDIEKSIEQDAERLIGRAYYVARNRIIFMSDHGKYFYIFLLFLPLYSFYYFWLAISTNQVSKFFTQYLKGVFSGLSSSLISKYVKRIPFSYHWILLQTMGNYKTILDVGCGDGMLMRDIARSDQKITGIDIYPESILLAKTSGVYIDAYKVDVTKMNTIKSKYELVFSSQVLEHLTKKKALQSIKVWEKLAKKSIVITTTNGYIDFEPIEDKEDLNPYQKHNSGWTKDEFIGLGYRVHGQGLQLIYGTNGLARKTPQWMIPFWGIISIVVAAIPYYFPSFSMYLIADKKIQ